MNTVIAQFLVWIRILFSPTLVTAVWLAIQDGEITSKELGTVVSKLDFKFKVPFVTMFKSKAAAAG